MKHTSGPRRSPAVVGLSDSIVVANHILAFRGDGVFWYISAVTAVLINILMAIYQKRRISAVAVILASR